MTRIIAIWLVSIYFQGRILKPIIMVTVEPKTFIQEYFEALSGKPKTLELVKKYVSDKELAEHIMAYEKAFPGYELIIEDLFYEVDKVAVRARIKAEHKGEFMGIAPTKKFIDVPLSVFYLLKEDKIEKGWLYIDRLELMDQLGVATLN